ncbi:cytochrome bd-I oxidase subunit CydX [Allorhizobium sp. BGMRC 0089]|nr:cytochrome bd-I oxidase subunit CydX [Allorhizobium sonneratiae]MCM2293074.1 cytochrome bd-I oxidase subunit CydX [Allorhizobium sonneratiae]
MWYFAWLLGLPLAALFGVVNAMWVEMQQDQLTMAKAPAKKSGSDA